MDVFRPASLDEAYSRLGTEEPSIRPLGGGTALMLMMKSKLFAPEAMVDLKTIDGSLAGIRFTADGTAVSIGAMTRFVDIEHDERVCETFPILSQTLKGVANPRVRNVATVGGNLAYADPHLDLPPVWTSLDAVVTIGDRNGERDVPLAEFFVGYYETALSQGELILRITVPITTGWQREYVKVTTRSAHDWPALGIALGLKHLDDKIIDARIVVSAATDCPTRLKRTEVALKGKRAENALFADAAETAVQETRIEGDSRGSAEYKRHLLKVNLVRALTRLSRAV
jgi:carbon-monoxide dehydrogenase medium subunit